MILIMDPALDGVGVTVCSWGTLDLLPSVQRTCDVALDKTATADNILVTFL